jgi:hypothetical protein
LLYAQNDADDLLGKFEVLAVEGSCHGRRVLEEAEVFVEEFGIVLDTKGRGVVGEFWCERGGGLGDSSREACARLIDGGELDGGDEGLLKRFRILEGAGDGDRIGMMNTVSGGLAACA